MIEPYTANSASYPYMVPRPVPDHEPEIAARLIDTAVLNAICAEGEIQKGARTWLLLDSEPAESSLFQPERGSFLWACRKLGIRWRDLRNSLRLGSAIDDGY